MRSFIFALLCLPLFVFGQDSLNTSLLSRISIASGPELGQIAVRDGFIYAAEGGQGLHVLDAREPAEWTEISFLESDESLFDVALLGDYAYVSGASDGLHIISIVNPAAPVEVGVSDVSSWKVKVFGTHAFLAGTTTLSILDLSIPTAPELVGTYDPPGDFWSSYPVDVDVVGNYAYVACADSGVRILDISDITIPTEVGVYRTSYGAYDISVSGNRAFTTTYWGRIEVIDISEPTTPLLIGDFHQTDVMFTDIQAVGDVVAATAKGLPGLQIYSVADPANFQNVGWHRLSWYSHQLILDDNIVYVNDLFGVEIFDISTALPIIETPNTVVSQFSLHPIYPNPFNNTANISFDLPREVTGRLVVYDVLGRMTNTLYDGKLAAGSHQMQFNGNGLSSGTYFIKLETPTFNATQKVVLLK